MEEVVNTIKNINLTGFIETQIPRPWFLVWFELKINLDLLIHTLIRNAKKIDNVIFIKKALNITFYLKGQVS